MCICHMAVEEQNKIGTKLVLPRGPFPTWEGASIKKPIVNTVPHGERLNTFSLGLRTKLSKHS